MLQLFGSIELHPQTHKKGWTQNCHLRLYYYYFYYYYRYHFRSIEIIEINRLFVWNGTLRNRIFQDKRETKLYLKILKQYKVCDRKLFSIYFLYLPLPKTQAGTGAGSLPTRASNQPAVCAFFGMVISRQEAEESGEKSSKETNSTSERSPLLFHWPPFYLHMSEIFLSHLSFLPHHTLNICRIITHFDSYA